MIKQKIETDLKEAMLAGDRELTSVLRTIKSVILDAEISAGARDNGLDDEILIGLLQKESKKRIDTAKTYSDANENIRAEKELAESRIISKYLPEMMSEDDIVKIVEETISGLGGSVSMQQMGQVIGAVKAKTGALADGSVVAKLVKERITN